MPGFPIAEGNLRQPGFGPRVKPDRRPKKATQEDEEKEEETEQKKGPESRENPRQVHEPDFWTLNDTVLVRHHRTPRWRLFSPSADDCPIPLEYVDVMRMTETDLEHPAERTIHDHWTSNDRRKLSDAWTGKTIFDLIHPDPGPGYKWVAGRLTEVRSNSTRPDSLWPEIWTRLRVRNRENRQG